MHAKNNHIVTNEFEVPSAGLFHLFIIYVVSRDRHDRNVSQESSQQYLFWKHWQIRQQQRRSSDTAHIAKGAACADVQILQCISKSLSAFFYPVYQYH